MGLLIGPGREEHLKRYLATCVAALALAGCGQINLGPTPTPTTAAQPTAMTVVIACQPCGSDPIKLGNTPAMQEYSGSVYNGEVCTVSNTYRDAGRYLYLVVCSSGETGWIDGKHLDLR
jgi:hypothetical protein